MFEQPVLLSYEYYWVQESLIFNLPIPRVLLLTWQNKCILALMYVIITAKYNKNINLMIPGRAQTVLKMSSVENAKKRNQNFRNLTSVHNIFIIFTSKWTFENDRIHIPTSNVYSYKQIEKTKMNRREFVTSYTPFSKWWSLKCLKNQNCNFQ